MRTMTHLNKLNRKMIVNKLEKMTRCQKNRLSQVIPNIKCPPQFIPSKLEKRLEKYCRRLSTTSKGTSLNISRLREI